MEELRFTSPDGGVVPLRSPELQALESSVAGELLWPGHPEFDRARRIWNGLVDKRPGLIVRCAREEDVVAAVRFARDHGLELAVRGGGHNVAGRAICEGGLVIDLSRLRAVDVDGPARRVRAGGGATLGDVFQATLPHGLATPLGVVSDTGIAGLTLHGGYGWLSRRWGLAADNLVAARVVLADGRLVRASADEEPDLFWALRGGGGNFGVVTSFEFRLHPIPPLVSFGFVVYPLDRAERVLRAYRDYAAQAPDELGLIAVFWSAPPLPQVPAAARGSPVLILLGVHSGELAAGAKALAPLRTADQPLADLSEPQPLAQVQRFFDDDYPNGRLYYWKSLYLPSLPDDVVARVRDETAARPSALTSIDVWALGGAIARVGQAETAFARRDAPFLVSVESNWDEPAHTNANIGWTRGLYRDLEGLAGGQTYLNFNVPGSRDEAEALLHGAYGPNYARLRALKARYDPDNLFHGNFNLAPA